MTVFIPENIIEYSLLFDNTINLHYDGFLGYIQSSIYNLSIFTTAKKISWSSFWKFQYFKREGPFFQAIIMNERFNWAYKQHLHKLTYRNSGLFDIKFVIFQSYFYTYFNLPFSFCCDKVGFVIYNYFYYYGFTEFTWKKLAIFDGLFWMSNMTSYILFIVNFFDVFDVYIGFSYFFYKIKVLIYLVRFDYIIMFLGIIISFLKVFIIFSYIAMFITFINPYIVRSFVWNFVFGFIKRYFIVLSYLERSTYLSLIVMTLNILKIDIFYKFFYELYLNYSKFNIRLKRLKEVEFLGLDSEHYYMYYILFFFRMFFIPIEIYLAIYSILYNLIFWRLRYIILPFYKTRFIKKFSLMFKKQIHLYWLYLKFFIFDVLRDTTIKSSFLGWLRWSQIYGSWDEFVLRKWDEIKEYVEKEKEIIQKRELEIESMEKNDVDPEKVILEKEKIEKEQLKRIKDEKIREENELRKKNIKKKVVESTDNNILPLGYYKTKLWAKLSDLFIDKLFIKKQEEKDEEIEYYEIKSDMEVTADVLKDLEYYNWLMDRKYLFVKYKFSYLDYTDFMDFQTQAFDYFFETLRVIKFMNGLFYVFGNLYQNRSPGEYGLFDLNLSLATFPRISLIKFSIFFKYTWKFSSFFIVKSFDKIVKNWNNNFWFVNYFFFYSYYYFKFIWICFNGMLGALFSYRRIMYVYYFYYLKSKLRFWLSRYFFYKYIVKFFSYLKYLIYIFKLPKLFFINIFKYFKTIIKKYIKIFFKLKIFFFNIWYFFYINFFKILTKFRNTCLIIILLLLLLKLSPFEFLTIIILNFCFMIKIFVLKLYVLDIEFYLSNSILYSNIRDFIYLETFEKKFYIGFINYTIDLNYFFIFGKFNLIFYYIKVLIDLFVDNILLLPLRFIYKIFNLNENTLWWTFWSSKTHQTLKFLYEQEYWRELIWRSKNFYKNLAGGFLIHPITRYMENKHGEVNLISNIFWYEWLKYDKKILISEISYHILSSIFVYPFWFILYGADYVIYWHYESGYYNGYLFLYAFKFKSLCIYIRSHIISYLFWQCWEIIYILFFTNNFIIRFIYFLSEYILDSFLYFWKFITYKYLFENVIFFKSWFFIIKNLIYFNLFYYTVGIFKFMLHFFQCFIIWIRFFYKYEVFFLIVVSDITRSIFYLYVIIASFIYILLHKIYIVFSHLFNIHLITIYFSELAHFLYNMMLVTSSNAFDDGLFNYWGKYGFHSSGHGGFTLIYYLDEFIDVFPHPYIKRDYIKYYRRWGLAFGQGFPDLRYFLFNKPLYSASAIGSVIFHVYMWMLYILFIIVFCFLSPYLKSFVKRKENAYTDSTYAWYRVTPNHRIFSFSDVELAWLTKNKWIKSFNTIKDVFDYDIFKEFKKDEKILFELILQKIKESMNLYNAARENYIDYNKFVNYLLFYTKGKYMDVLLNVKKENVKVEYIRYAQIGQVVFDLFEQTLLNKKIIRDVFKKKLEIELPKYFDLGHLLVLRRGDQYHKLPYHFFLPYIFRVKNNFNFFKYISLKKNEGFRLSILKALNLITANKDDQAKDIHDFYFLEQSFYNELVDRWLWMNIEKGNILSNIAGSRQVNRMVYSTRRDVPTRYFDSVFIEYIYNYLDYLIKISDMDKNYFGNMFNFTFYNVLMTHRLVKTELTAKIIEKKVLEDYDAFLEVGWEQNHTDEGIIHGYKELSKKLYSSFLNTEEKKKYYKIEYDDIKYKEYFKNRLCLRNVYTPLADEWLGLSIILPICILFYFFNYFVVYSVGSTRFVIFNFEIYYMLPYVFYNFIPYLFYSWAALKFFSFPKNVNRRRKWKTIAYSRLDPIVNKYLDNGDIAKIVIAFITEGDFFIIMPTYDFLVFYIIFFLCCIIFLKLAMNHDLV